jgi:hypothetical protein
VDVAQHLQRIELNLQKQKSLENKPESVLFSSIRGVRFLATFDG